MDDNISMVFWDHVKAEIKRLNTTQEWLSNKIGVPFGTFRKWISRETLPDANQAVLIAKELNTTVEELMDGDSGRQYIISWAEKNSGKWKAPERIADLVQDSLVLNDQDLETAKYLVHGLAEKSQKANENLA
jgi:hypothetical protein